MTGHIPLDRLQDGDPTAAERAHLDQCARCRVEARLLSEISVEPAPDVILALDAIRHRERATLSSSLQLASTLVFESDDTEAVRAIGAHASRFEPLRWVGAGPLGPVIEVRERDGGRRLALTVLADKAVAARLWPYVGAFALDRPRCLAPPVLLDETRGTSAVGTPWVSGTPLVDLFEGALDPLRPDRSRGGDLPRAVVALVGVAAGLVHLHAAGLVHGHVAPDRVTVDRDGHAVLRDAGMWATDSAVAAWSAPERRGGQDPTPASDVYGLGALLRHALAGRPPRDGESLVDVDEELAALAAWLCAADPSQRPAAGLALAALIDVTRTDARFVELGPLGRGGMAEVRRVLDPQFDRALALKAILPELADNDDLVERFLAEARVTALLAHPGIVPVHHLGRLPDGRPFFTMKEIKGRTLAEVIPEAHAGTPSGWTVRRLLEAFLRVCETVAYAHDSGVLHRDLKPSNVMVGEYGEVLVLDWGLARLARGRGPATGVAVDPHHTRVGTVSGTPGYMSPEQSRGEIDRLSPASDVYALGAFLREILDGRGPAELDAIAAKALSEAPEDRYADGAAMALVLQAWLDGAVARDRAMEDVHAARAKLPEADAGRARAVELERQAERLLAGVASWAPEEHKHDAWQLQDLARELRVQADLGELEAVQRLHAAFTRVPDLPEARALLAQLARRDHQAAEEAGALASREEALLRLHAEALPADHPERAGHMAWLAGTGAVTLITDPPAEVLLHRYVLHRRRLVPVFERSLGRTPLRAVSLPMGSWLLVLRAEGRREVRYPVFLRRQEHWDGVPPGSTEALPIALPREEDLGADDCYVPAGWTWLAGDPERDEPQARRRWVPAFVARRFPVTNAEYLQFLDDLVARGRTDAALRHVPGLGSGTNALDRPVPMYAFDGRHFALQPDSDGDEILPDFPVVMIEWWGARAYATWAAERSGLGWRLAADAEWEKAARGVDRRLYPWGDHLDPTWCNMRLSQSPSRLMPVDSFPVDDSPYGVRGMAGNVRDWAARPWAADPTEPGEDADLTPASDVPVETRMTSRGGDWFSRPRTCRLTYRSAGPSVIRNADLGFRIFRSWP